MSIFSEDKKLIFQVDFGEGGQICPDCLKNEKRWDIIINKSITRLRKTAALRSAQRAGGWCKPVGERAFPFFERPVIEAGRLAAFILPVERPALSGNLGGNAEDLSSHVWWEERLFYCPLVRKRLCGR